MGPFVAGIWNGGIGGLLTWWPNLQKRSKKHRMTSLLSSHPDGCGLVHKWCDYSARSNWATGKLRHRLDLPVAINFIVFHAVALVSLQESSSLYGVASGLCSAHRVMWLDLTPGPWRRVCSLVTRRYRASSNAWLYPSAQAPRSCQVSFVGNIQTAECFQELQAPQKKLDNVMATQGRVLEVIQKPFHILCTNCGSWRWIGSWEHFSHLKVKKPRSQRASDRPKIKSWPVVALGQKASPPLSCHGNQLVKILTYSPSHTLSLFTAITHLPPKQRQILGILLIWRHSKHHGYPGEYAFFVSCY